MNRTNVIVSILALAALAIPTLASAHMPPGSTELSAKMGAVDNDLLLGVGIARNMQDGWALEGNLSFLPDQNNQALIFGNAIYNLNTEREARTVPFLTAGVGSYAANPAVNFGIGVKIFMDESLLIRAEALDNVIFENDEDNINNFQIDAGLTWLVSCP